jgi:hypothetical protein
MPTTNVPQPALTAAGFVIPTQAAVLAGVQQDFNAAFGGNLNPALNTPQGQLATSEAAIVLDADAQFIALANSMDPAYATGRMQDAIGRIYLMTRIAAASTTVTATCSGAPGTIIPVGSQAQDQAANSYISTIAGTIGAGGTVSITFASVATGAIACPIGYLNAIYASIPGWDSITNPAAGVIGNAVETRAAFEFRRQNSVAANGVGMIDAVLGAVFAVPNVLDAYAIQNDYSVTSGATFTGSITGTTLTVATTPSNPIKVGMTITGTGVTDSVTITAFGTGTGSTGDYALGKSVAATGSQSLLASFGGIQLVPNSIYVAAYGGVAQAIANAIWLKKAPGANYNGNTTLTVVDNVNYQIPYPTYSVTFQIPTSVPVLFAIAMQQNAAVPANATALITAAITAAFTGSDGGQRARIGSWLFASRFYAGIAALGAWATVYSIQIGITTANQNSVLMNINQMPTVGTISVTYS